MNRFRTKKKSKDAPEGLNRPSTDSDGSTTPAIPAVKTSKSFGFGKKQALPEPKVELDVANALPSSDDFRTSLLMSGLSARFSMLREQDDPNSKIGKASDDSVLFPSKRQSRLVDFGFQTSNLADIAEVSSIMGSIRPPFALSRTDSFGTTNSSFAGLDDDTGGSIMNRAKPGEGNNLFGGRQKIYKIPMGGNGSSKNLADGTNSGMGGRALYEHDVSQSAFQKLRERERELQQEQRDREDAEQHLQASRAESPPPSNYNRNRETSSTTSSAGPSITRSSTAATSVTSHRTPSLSGPQAPNGTGVAASNAPGIERSMTKTRRLYDTGLDQHLHEQQSSAMSRIDTLTRQRALGPHTPPAGLNSPTTFAPPADRWGSSDRPDITGKASMPNLRTKSPSPTLPYGAFDFGSRMNSVAERKQNFGLSSPPLSPPVSESDDQAVLGVQPNDKGKATALGTFSKPVQPYDEKKYTQRQLQMQQGRETPPPRTFAPRQQPVGRSRGDSNATFASGRSRSNSSAQRQFLPQQGSIQETTASRLSEDDTMETGTFLSSPNSSSLGDVPETEVRHPIKPSDLYNKYRQEQELRIARPPESQHPANRLGSYNEPADGIPSPASKVPQARLRIEESPSRSASISASLKADPSDSPTLGPTSGLSGMVRQHLRSDSNASSGYGAPSPDLSSRFPQDNVEQLSTHDYNINDWDHQSDYGDNNFSLEDEYSNIEHGVSAPLPLSTRSPNIEPVQDEQKKAWEKDVETHHRRDGSSETQREQQDFKMDLAARRKRVQDNLKNFVETESRSASPMMGGSEWPKDGHVRNNPLGMLKTKTSRGSMAGRQNEPKSSKAKKMLGLGNATISSAPSLGKSSMDEHSWREEEEEMLRGVNQTHTAPIIPPQTKAFRQARRDAQRDREQQVAMRNQQRQGEAGGQDFQDWQNTPDEHQPRQREPSKDRVPPNIRTNYRAPSRERHPPPVVNRIHRTGANQDSQGSVGRQSSDSRPASRSSRDRSSSDASASARSKSRNGNGRYRDESARPMPEPNSRPSQEGLVPPSGQFLPKSPGTPGLPYYPSPRPSPVPSPMMSNSPATTGRDRSNSKSGYFDGQSLQPLKTDTGIDIGLSPRPSPVTPFSVHSTPSLIPPSPAGSGMSTTPTMPGFPTQQVRTPGARKKSVNKSEISEPRFISSTSRVSTVNLPPGSSLHNGTEFNAPPIPPVNPRRKTRTMFGFSKKDDAEVDYSMPSATHSTEEVSTFSADEESRPKVRQKLRKSSSEGGNLNVKARQAVNAAPSPAIPAFPPGAFPRGGSPPQKIQGGMF